MFCKDDVVVANSQFSLVKAIVQQFGCSVVHTDLRNFADTESVVPLEDHGLIQGRRVILVPQFSFNSKEVYKNSINEQLLEILFLAHQVKAHRATQIIAVMPYVPYTRQSRSITGTYVGLLQAVGAFCKSVGIDLVVSCDLHEELCTSIFAVSLKEIPLYNVWGTILRNYLTPDELKKICFLSPDRGGINRVKAVAQLFDAEWAFVEKRRVNFDETVALDLVGDVAGKTVVMIDDIVDTGRTAVEASKMAVMRGAKKIVACFSHAVLSFGAIEIIDASDIEKVWVTNSVYLEQSVLGKKITVVPIEDDIVGWLKTNV